MVVLLDGCPFDKLRVKLLNCYKLWIMLKRLLFLLAGLFPISISAQITVSGFNHLALSVSDIEASTVFYRDILGLEPIEVPDELKAIRSWFRFGGGQDLHLLAGRTGADYVNTGEWSKKAIKEAGRIPPRICWTIVSSWEKPPNSVWKPTKAPTMRSPPTPGRWTLRRSLSRSS